MLVLTRRPGEQIIIGDNIRITVVSVGPGRVKIGIDAPPHVTVNRQEIHEKIQHEQASDVLATVGQVQADEPSPTVVIGGDTATRIHNRIADKLPASPVSESIVPQAATPGLSKYRLPRKPR